MSDNNTNETDQAADIPIKLSISIGEVVKRWREHRGLKLTELANKAGLTKGYLSQLEHDRVKRPNDQHLAKLAGALGIEVWDLLHRRMPDEEEVEETVPRTRQRLGSYASPRGFFEPSPSIPTTTGQHIDELLNAEGLSNEEQEMINQTLIQHTKKLIQLLKYRKED